MSISVRIALAAALALGVPEAPAWAQDGLRMDRILQRGRLIVGVKTDYPPWGMVAADGSIVGLEPDLARDVADRLGVGLELVPVTAATRLQRLEQGQVDLVIATLGDTEERRLMSDLIQPHYYASGVSLLARADAPFSDWGQLRGRPVCLTDGAYFNRTLTERYLIHPVVFPGTRDATMALKDGRCVGWAFDDTVLARMLSEPDWAGYRLGLPTILSTPWSVAVARGEGDGVWGHFIADRVAEWHRSGSLVELQAKWGLPPNAFLVGQEALWSGAIAGGPDCARIADGRFPPACLGADVARAGPPAVRPAWADELQRRTGIDLAPLIEPFDRTRLLHGAGLTLAVSFLAIAGSLSLGLAFAWVLRAVPAGRVGRLAVLPLRALVAVTRMTPPILQLYIVFFGFGGFLAGAWGVTPGSFVVAVLVFSLYAGGTNTVLLDAALGQLRAEQPEVPAHRLLPAAIERCYEGLVATSVNIVKAAGLASTIALPETVAAVNTVLAEGADPTTLMNLLVVFYFLLVVAVLWVLRAGRSLVRRWA